MIPMRLAEIAEVVGGEAAPGHADVTVGGEAYLDTRAAVADGLFVAMVGEHVDGHDYATGAHAVLGTRATEAPTVVVDGVEAALAALARHLLGRLSPRVIAMTGSQGKTGTKDYLAHLLADRSQPDRVVATRGNFNNELGVPLTVLRATEHTEHLVVEMGARGIGHIAHLCSIARPDVSALLNVGSAHIGEFGSAANIALAKGEIYEALDADSGIAVVNLDDPYSRAEADRTGARRLTSGGPDSGADLTWSRSELDERGRAAFVLSHAGAERPVRLRQAGGFQLLNATAAAAMALAVGVPLDSIAERLSSATAASRWRMEETVREDGLLVLNDAYNANPEAMLAALETLAAVRRPGRRIAVLGEMRELGDAHDAGHHRVGEAAARTADVLVVVGEPAAGIAEGARGAGMSEVSVTASVSDAAVWLGENVGPDDVVLLKASRGAALDRLADHLLQKGT